jgi:hypothetical protein
MLVVKWDHLVWGGWYALCKVLLHNTSYLPE